MKKLGSALVMLVAFLGGAGEIWAVDWGECQRTEVSNLQPDIVIPACSRIIDAGEASQADLAAAYYRRGRGYHKEEDLDRAIADYDRAIERNPDLAAAYNSRGVAYDDKGELDRAIADYRKAAEQGHADAQINLGVMYRDGQSVPQDYAEAVRWFRKAAEQGDAEAQTSLGVMYAVGRGVTQDDTEAVKWYNLAAEQGPADAQNNLGLMYASGRGVPQDFVQAHMWFHIAAALGDEMAKRGQNKVASRMTPDQIAEAQRMAREWLAKYQL